MENFEEKYAQKKSAIEDKADALTRILMQQGRQEDILRAARDAKYREKLYQELYY